MQCFMHASEFVLVAVMSAIVYSVCTHSALVNLLLKYAQTDEEAYHCNCE
jgi:hypothetical protein